MTGPDLADEELELGVLPAEPLPQGSDKRSFGDLARVEGRRFWTSRARRFWTFAVFLIEVGLLFALVLTTSPYLSRRQSEFVLTVCLHGLTHLALWGSAWIGSDLLSRQRTDNADPTYDPPPSEVLAGFAGRHIPFWAGYLSWLITFAGACGIGAVDTSLLDGQLPV